VNAIYSYIKSPLSVYSVNVPLIPREGGTFISSESEAISRSLFELTKILFHSRDLFSFFESMEMILSERSITNFAIHRYQKKSRLLDTWSFSAGKLNTESASFTQLNSYEKRVLILNSIEIDPSNNHRENASGCKIYVPVEQGALFGSAFSSTTIELTEPIISGIQTLGSLIGLWFRSLPADSLKVLNNLSRSEFGSLTKRQQTIFLKMREGQTNLAIAKQLGYSESLVKAESVKIFKALEITGRQDPRFQSDFS